jgi:hypothetical protein
VIPDARHAPDRRVRRDAHAALTRGQAADRAMAGRLGVMGTPCALTLDNRPARIW